MFVSYCRCGLDQMSREGNTVKDRNWLRNSRCRLLADGLAPACQAFHGPRRVNTIHVLTNEPAQLSFHIS